MCFGAAGDLLSLHMASRRRERPTRPRRAAAPALAKVPGARAAELPDWLEPQKATLVRGPPSDDAWLHELKFDGYRILGRCEKGRARLLTRSEKDWTERMPTLSSELGRRSGRDSALFDGEIVVLREDGVSDFQKLQNALGGDNDSAIVYYVFDLLHYRGYDLSGVPLEERKRLLAELIAQPGERVRYSDHVIGEGPAFFGQACSRGLEGIISKRRSDPYRSGRTTSWLKSKCVGRQEFVIVGFSEPAGSRAGVGALLLAVHEGKSLRYVGRVGTGFTRKSLAELRRKLAPLEQAMPALVNAPTGSDARGVHWVRPSLVAEVEFGSFTDEGMLRHSSFRGLRGDKAASEVVQELPAPSRSARRFQK